MTLENIILVLLVWLFIKAVFIMFAYGKEYGVELWVIFIQWLFIEFAITFYWLYNKLPQLIIRRRIKIYMGTDKVYNNVSRAFGLKDEHYRTHKGYMLWKNVFFPPVIKEDD